MLHIEDVNVTPQNVCTHYTLPGSTIVLHLTYLLHIQLCQLKIVTPYTHYHKLHLHLLKLHIVTHHS